MALAHSIDRFAPALDPPMREIEADVLARADRLHAVLSLIAVKSDRVARAATVIIEAIAAGHLVLACGNGGSAAEAQHLVGELVGRFLREREPWPAIALTTDSSVMTAIANDYGYDTVFARQVAALGRSGDVLVAFSTSGASPSVINAAREARERGMQVIAFTGQAPNALARMADVDLVVPAAETPLVQEVHAVLLHLICEMVESSLAGAPVRKDVNR
jgi:D-sedoheptulose 7-phosphate isomerase